MPPFDLVLDRPLTDARRDRGAPVVVPALVPAVVPAIVPAVGLRVMHAADARALGAFYDGLSQASRSARFHCGVPSLPPAWLARLTQADDPNAHVLLAVAGVGTMNTIVGEARYAYEPEVGAEFAMVVADSFQGRGLGRWMLERLVRAARDAGITMLYGDVQRDNEPMLALARAAGFRPRRSDDPRLVTVERKM